MDSPQLPGSPIASSSSAAGHADDAQALQPSKDGVNSTDTTRLEAMCKVMDSQLEFFKPFLPHVAIKLNIPKILGFTGCPLTALEMSGWLACAGEPNMHNLERILRALVLDEYLVQLEGDDHEPEPRFQLTVLGEALRKAAARLGGGRVSVVDCTGNEVEEEEVSPFLLRAYSYSHLHEAVLPPVVVPLDKAAAAGPKLLELFGRDEAQATALFMHAMAEASNMHLTATLPSYSGFREVETVVDVGGADGSALATIVEHNPNVKGINFDLPEVVATAAPISGVTHVGGDMFHSIPKGDAIYLKWILHELNDQDGLKVLANCLAALSPDCKGRKVIIQDTVVPPMTHPDKDRIRSAVYLDLAMMANTRGYERTEAEWKSLLSAAGFPHVTVFNYHSVYFSILEAKPGLPV